MSLDNLQPINNFWQGAKFGGQCFPIKAFAANGRILRKQIQKKGPSSVYVQQLLCH